MDKKLKNLLNQLKGKTFPVALHHELGRYGDEAFDLLLGLVTNKSSTEKEASNALIIMLSMCCQPCANRSQELFDLSKPLLDSQSKIIRSQAVKVVIGLISISIDSPTICKLNISDMEGTMSTLLSAREVGVEKEIEIYLDSWLKEYENKL